MPDKPHHSSPLDKLLGRIEDLDPANLAVLVQRLARERKLLETVFHVIHEGILVINERGIIEYANTAGYRMTGLKPQDIGSAVLWKLLPDLARTLPFQLDSLAKNTTVISRELQLTYPENRYVRFNLVPFTDSKEEEVEHQFAIILSDITEEKMSTDELIENERINSIMMLAAGVAHELGNPLNSLNIHLLQKLKSENNSDKNERIGNAINVCVDEVARLDSIITHFLEAIRPSTPNLTDVNIILLLEDVLSFLKHELKNMDVKVDLIITDLPPEVLADREQIRQTFFNVIKNSMEAMSQGGSLKISTQVDDEFVSIYFADTGVGIDEEDIAHVFQPYYTTKATGHGLGMMIVQRIMREHGGSIGIDSRKGTGTVVHLQFPLKERRQKMLEFSEE